MRAMSRKLTIGTAVVGLILTGLIGLAACQLPEWEYESDSGDREQKLDDLMRSTAERREINHGLTVDLASRRISLAHAIELLIRVNTEWDGYLTTIQLYFPAPSREESVALNLLYRVGLLGRETPTTQPDVINGLEDEFASLFGRRPPTEANARPAVVATLAQVSAEAPRADP